MELRIGDRFIGESGGGVGSHRPALHDGCGKTAHPGERKVGQRRLTDVQTWSDPGTGCGAARLVTLARVAGQE